MKHRAMVLSVVAFVSGFSLMVFELVAARILAPSIGSSTFVWTSVIGVIIAALSVGYFVGGKLADKRATLVDISWLLLASGLLIALTRLFYLPVMDWTLEALVDPRIQAVLGSLILFAPTSFVLGAISPYLVKMNITTLDKSGQSVARLSAYNAIGSIVGTFLAGFIIFQHVGARETLILVIFLLIATSWTILPRQNWRWRVTVTLILSILAIIPAVQNKYNADVDTASAHYQIINFADRQNTYRGLVTGPGGVQSAVNVDGTDDLVFWYTREMAQKTLEKKPAKILMLGGGAFTLPQYLSARLPGSQIDVVEIDPGLKQISEKYFHYKNPANVKLIFDDARRFLNVNHDKYDVILVDVYGDATIPFSLATTEYATALEADLAPKGIVIANIIGGLKGGPCQEVIGRLGAAYQTKLPQAYYTTDRGYEYAAANFVVTFSRSGLKTAGTPLPVMSEQPYTDNFAPTEALYFRCNQANRA